jgi:hypothetical protein
VGSSVGAGVVDGDVVWDVVVPGVVVPGVVGGAVVSGVVDAGAVSAGEVSADVVAGGVVGVGSSALGAGASQVGGVVTALDTGSCARKVGSALGSNQSSVPGGTTPMVGMASGPAALRHSVGTVGCALATVVAPSCTAIAVGVWPMATSPAAASTPQLVWSARTVTSVRRGTGRPPKTAPRIGNEPQSCRIVWFAARGIGVPRWTGRVHSVERVVVGRVPPDGPE